MKKIILALLAVAFAAKVEAAPLYSFGLLWEAAVDYPLEDLSQNWTAYLFALGNGWGSDTPTFADGSFNGTTLTSTDGNNFSAMGFDEFDISVDGGTFRILGANGYLEIIDSPSLSINQWWALVIVDSVTPGRFGIDVFEYSGINDIGWADCYRFLDGLGTGNWGPIGVDNPDEYTHWEVVDKVFNPREFSVIPEPATGLLALGGVALLVAQRRKRK